MAVDTEKTVVLNIDAEKGIKSLKELKQAIKDGKDALVGLEQGSEEYNQVLSQTAEYQHQLKEITQQVNQSTMDFGQTISNINGVMTGGVAAVQGMTSALSLMGVDMGDDNKLTQTLIKSMALLQSMSKMDAAIKSFKALTVAVKATTLATGGLGKALKALVASNPIGLLLVAATALIGVFSALISKANELAKESAKSIKDNLLYTFKQLTTWSDKFKDSIEQAINVLKGGSSEEINAFWDNQSTYVKQAQKQLADFRTHLFSLRKEYEQSEKPMMARYKAEQKYLEENAKAIGELRQQIEEEESKSENVDQAKIKNLQAQIDGYTALNNLLLQEQQTWTDVTVYVDELNRAIEATGQISKADEETVQAMYEPLLDNFMKMIEQFPELRAQFTYWRKDGVKSVDDLNQALDQLLVNYNFIQDQFAKRGLFNLSSQQDQDRIMQQFAQNNAQVATAQRAAEKQRRQQAKEAQQKREQQQAAAYKHELSLLKQANAELLYEEELRYRKEQILYENNTEKLEEAELAHQKKVMEINNQYLQQQIELANKRLEILNKQNVNNSKQSEIDTINEQIAEMTRQIQLNTNAYEDNSRAVEKARIQRELELKQNKQRLAMQKKLHEQQMETEGVMQQLTQDEIDGIKERMSWLDYLGISYTEKYQMMMEKQRELLELEQQEKEAKLNVESIEQEIQLWHEKYDQIEDLTAEHYAELLQLQEDYDNALANLGALRQQRIQKELDEEVQTRMQYANAVANIMGKVGSILVGLTDLEGVAFEDQKKLKIAAATISTIEGGINAYMSYIASPILPPADSILGGIAAAATVAMGMIEIAKIRQTKPGNSPSLSGTAMQGITLANPQIVNLNAVNDEIELPDTRVYVLESDITEAQNRVHVVENNSSF